MDFHKLNKIGEGTYGTVYRAKDKATQEIVALKKLRMDKEKSGFPLTSIREIKILRSLQHPNVVQLREVAVGRKPDSIFLVFEYCEHDFAALLDRMTRSFHESEVKTIMLQLLEAVNHLHRNFIVHRDLKLSNLLMNSKGVIKLADFGLARLFGNPLREYTPKVVTLWYRPPELLLGSETYHTAVDMWAMGCIFGELLRHKPLLPGKNEMDQLELIFKLLGTPSEKIWPGLSKLNTSHVHFPHYPYNNLSAEFPNLSENGLDLLSRLLTYDPSKRLTAEKALAHPYFKESPLPISPELFPTFPAMTEAKSRAVPATIAPIVVKAPSAYASTTTVKFKRTQRDFGEAFEMPGLTSNVKRRKQP